MALIRKDQYSFMNPEWNYVFCICFQPGNIASNVQNRKQSGLMDYLHFVEIQLVIVLLCCLFSIVHTKILHYHT